MQNIGRGTPARIETPAPRAQRGLGSKRGPEAHVGMPGRCRRLGRLAVTKIPAAGIPHTRSKANGSPAIYEFDWIVRDGGLMSHAPGLDGTFARVPALVDRIFQGARPEDLPFEQPTRFEFVINLKTAKALGLTIPEVGHRRRGDPARRREFIAGLGGAAWPLAAYAQQHQRQVGRCRCGFTAALRKGLGESRCVEGQNVTVEYHWLAGKSLRITLAGHCDLDNLRRCNFRIIVASRTPYETPKRMAHCTCGTAHLLVVGGIKGRHLTAPGCQGLPHLRGSSPSIAALRRREGDSYYIVASIGGLVRIALFFLGC
jgi:hypothetical protein